MILDPKSIYVSVTLEDVIDLLDKVFGGIKHQKEIAFYLKQTFVMCKFDGENITIHFRGKDLEFLKGKTDYAHVTTSYPVKIKITGHVHPGYGTSYSEEDELSFSSIAYKSGVWIMIYTENGKKKIKKCPYSDLKKKLDWVYDQKIIHPEAEFYTVAVHLIYDSVRRKLAAYKLIYRLDVEVGIGDYFNVKVNKSRKCIGKVDELKYKNIVSKLREKLFRIWGMNG